MNEINDFDFCLKRISEQMKHIKVTRKRVDINDERKGELLLSSKKVLASFMNHLSNIVEKEINEDE